MRTRPVRPNIYLPVVRFGVADSDWFSVLLISCAAYLVPVPFGITVLYVPLQMWTWLLGTAGSIAFFNYIRIGKRPYWLQHKLRAICFHHRQYRALPNGKKRGFKRSWLIQTDMAEPTVRSYTTVAKTSLLLDHNFKIQEAYEERWKDSLATTS
jgi:hypothetical protein